MRINNQGPYLIFNRLTWCYITYKPSSINALSNTKIFFKSESVVPKISAYNRTNKETLDNIKNYWSIVRHGLWHVWLSHRITSTFTFLPYEYWYRLINLYNAYCFCVNSVRHVLNLNNVFTYTRILTYINKIISCR